MAADAAGEPMLLQVWQAKCSKKKTAKINRRRRQKEIQGGALARFFPIGNAKERREKAAIPTALRPVAVSLSGQCMRYREYNSNTRRCTHSHQRVNLATTNP